MIIRKVILTKFVPALLIAALVLNFSAFSSLAYSEGSYSDCDTIIDSIGNSQRASILKGFLDDATLDVSNTSITMFRVTFNSSLISVCFITSQYPLVYDNGFFYSTEPSDHIYWCDGGSNYNTMSLRSELSSSSPSSNGYYLVSNNNSFNFGYWLGSSDIWSNYDFYVNGSLAASFNLDASSYIPDNRVLTADLVDRYGSTYIAVTVSDNISDDWDGSYSFVTVTGNSTGIPFTYTFGFNEYIEKQGDPPYAFFLLDPSSIPYDVFSLSSLEYVSSGSFGSLSIPVDFTFGESPIEYNPINNNYYWSSTAYTEYNGGSAWGFDYIKIDNVDGDFWDDKKVLIQPFSFSVMAIPIMPSGITSMDYYVELVNDYLSYFDVILTEVPEITFDNLYGAGAFDDFQHSVSWVHYGNFLMDVSEWYSSHVMISHPLSYEFKDDLPIYNSSQYCGIAFSDHFYFKQLSYMLGDTSDILTEFSSRFYEEDGFSQTLLVSLSNIHDTEKSFFDNAWYYLERQNYFINDLILNKYIPDSVDLLKDIKELLTDILNALGENAPIDINDLESPLLDIYQFIDALYQGSKTKISDLRLTLKAVSSGVLPDGNGGEIYLLPTGTPTPVPLPTIPVLPVLP